MQIRMDIRDVIMPTSIKSNTAEFSIVDKKVLWVEANLKETDLTNIFWSNSYFYC